MTIYRQGREELWGVLEIFYILVAMVVTWVNSLVNYN